MPLPKKRRAKIAVFCSGNGSNLQAILDAERKGRLGASVEIERDLLEEIED